MHQSEQSRAIPTLIKDRTSSILQSRGDGQYYGFLDDRNGNAIALKFKLSTGEHRAIHYHDILSPMDFNGDNEIILATTRVQITIKGKELEKLFDRIIQHQVLWIKEPDGSFLKTGEDKVEITDVIFEMAG